MTTQQEWKSLAEANGWTVVERDPEGSIEEPCLYHEDLDRVWPLGDWEGACRDIGLPHEDGWSGSPCPEDPDNYWIDDKTGERVCAETGDRTPVAA